MFFTRKPKTITLLVEAIHKINDAGMIAYEYQQDYEYMPSEKELRLFERLKETLFQNKLFDGSAYRSQYASASTRRAGRSDGISPNPNDLGLSLASRSL